jgi:poly-beta-1,6-N-acetyl-D-glucosamine synthase
MKLVFWSSVALLAYTYAGYPLWLYLRKSWRSLPVRRASITPFVSIIVAVHNEARVLPRKLQNLFDLDYRRDQYEVIVVSDGSTDGSEQILRACNDPRLRPVFSAERSGKAAALNLGIAQSRGEIVVFSDARQLLRPDALRKILPSFNDPSIGCVSGSLLIGDPQAALRLSGEKVKWGIENKIREWEGSSGSVVGALGAFYAVRKSALVPLPAGTLLDDCYLPLSVVRNGGRVVFESEALAWDDVNPTPQDEFRRKVRTLTGNYQLIQLAPWVLSPGNPVWFEFLSHKLLRLLGPFALMAILFTSFRLHGGVYAAAIVLQAVFYTLALLGIMSARLGWLGKFAGVALTLVVLNGAAAVAFANFVTGRKNVWVR